MDFIQYLIKSIHKIISTEAEIHNIQNYAQVIHFSCESFAIHLLFGTAQRSWTIRIFLLFIRLDNERRRSNYAFIVNNKTYNFYSYSGCSVIRTGNRCADS